MLFQSNEDEISGIPFKDSELNFYQQLELIEDFPSQAQCPKCSPLKSELETQALMQVKIEAALHNTR